jgi:HlyD family secretion protein
VSTAPSTPPGERALRLVTRVGQAAQPWLRREAWTREGLKAAAVSLRETVRRDPRRAAAVTAGVLLALVLVRAVWPSAGPAGIATAVVRQAPFRVSVVESGTLQALRSVSYSSTIQSNQAKIVALAPEGRFVQKSDLLILFDAAPFEEEITKSEALLSQAQADLNKAQQDYKLQQIENGEDLNAARLKMDRSELELRDVEQGKGLVKEQEAKVAVANAERELKKAEGAYEDLKPLLDEGFITKQELDRAQQAVNRASEDLALARQKRDALVQYGRPLEVTQAKSDAQSTKETVRQMQSVAQYKLQQKISAIKAAESRIRESNSKLALARLQLARTEVRADVPGIVVYRPVFFGSEQRKPQVGDQVWANQPLLILPDVSKMIVETRVRETDIHKIASNQQVQVSVDAYPELRLTGHVTLIGSLAEETKDKAGTKYFGVTVQIDQSEPRLRPGMTARVDIQVEQRDKALSVPLDAVFSKDGKNVAYVARRGRAVPRELVLGPSNADFVVVERGLEEGDRVLLQDPTAQAATAPDDGP